MNWKPADYLTLVLVACAILTLALVVRRELLPEAVGGLEEVRLVEDWETLADVGSVVGSRQASVRIVEFSDFQCPFCAQVHLELRKLQEEHADQVAIIYRHLPLEDIHAHAVAAALASECAGAQGRFEAYHDALFEQQSLIGVRSWERFAEDARVPDSGAFERCLAERRFEDRVREDISEARRIGVLGTPTFILDDRMVSGVEAPKLLSLWVRDALSPEDTLW